MADATDEAVDLLKKIDSALGSNLADSSPIDVEDAKEAAPKEKEDKKEKEKERKKDKPKEEEPAPPEKSKKKKKTKVTTASPSESTSTEASPREPTTPTGTNYGPLPPGPKPVQPSSAIPSFPVAIPAELLSPPMTPTSARARPVIVSRPWPTAPSGDDRPSLTSIASAASGFDEDDESGAMYTAFTLFGQKIAKPSRLFISFKTKKEVKELLTGPNRLTLYVHYGDESKPYRPFEIQPSALVQLLLYAFADNISCHAPDYFAFCERLEDGTERWLEFDKTLADQSIRDKSHLYFKVKIFKMPATNLDAVSLDLFYSQIRKSVLQGDYFVPETIAVVLAALQCQISLGNYSSASQLASTLTAATLGDFLTKEYVRSSPVDQWVPRIARIHKLLYGLSAVDAKWAFLTFAKKLPAFGASLVPVMQGKLKVTLGVVEDGLLLFRDDERTNVQFFPFHNILEYYATPDGLTVRVVTQPDTHLDPIEMKIKFTIPIPQAKIVVILLDDYSAYYDYEAFPNRQGNRQSRVMGDGGAEGRLYQPITPRELDPFLSKLNHLLYHYRLACLVDKAMTSEGLIDFIDQTCIHTNKPLSTLVLTGKKLDAESLGRLAKAFEKNEDYSKSANRLNRDVNISSLNLADNSIPGTVSGLLKSFQTLTVLNLSSNSFPKLDYEGLATALSEVAPNLQEFFYSNNAVSDKVLPTLVKPFLKSKNLRLIDLSDNKIGNFEAVGELFKACPSLQVLLLANNKLSDTAFEALLNALHLASTCQLQELDVRGNSFGTKGCTALAEFLKADKRLQVLKISNLGLGKSAAAVLAPVLPDAGLKQLDVGGNDFQQKGWKDMGKALMSCMTLSHLEVTGSADKYGWPVLAATIVDLKALRSVSFASNSTLLTQGLPLLQEPLKAVAHIRLLDLSDTGISKREAGVIKDFLVNNKSLTRVNLSKNKLADEGANFLSDVLSKNEVLLHLNLEFNGITSAGSRDLSDGLGRAKHSAIQTISLGYNALGADCIEGWVNALRTGETSLLSLNLQGNPIDLSPAKRRELTRMPTLCIILLPWS